VVKVISHKASPPQTDNVPSHKGTLAPHGEYVWTCASFGPPESVTQTASRSVQLFLHSSRHRVAILYNGSPLPLKIASSYRGSVPLSNAWFPGPIQAHNSYGISMNSAVFELLIAECPYTSQCMGYETWGPDPPMGVAILRGKGGPLWRRWTLCREMCRNGWTDRDAVWVVDSGGPKEARVTRVCTLALPGEYDWTVHVRRLCKNGWTDLNAIWGCGLGWAQETTY